jgi:chromosome partitioning protein
MKTVAVTINKGGAGKTMLCRTLGTAAADAGLFVLLIDMDTQQNSTSWRKRRPGDLMLPQVQFTTEKDLDETLKRAETAGCDLVLIDTPPGRSAEAPAAVEAADLVLIPCTSEPECLEGLPRTAKLAQRIGTPAIVIPNFVHPSGKAEEELIRTIAKANGLVAGPVALHEFDIHRQGSLAGKTAQELDPNSRAANEINNLWKWLYAELHSGSAASLHNEVAR